MAGGAEAGGRRRAAVLGHPIAHSLSPALHRAAYRALGLDWAYDAVDVDVARLPTFLDGLGPEWVGLSLTMPLKEAVLPLLDEVEPLAAEVRAVNTVLLAGGRRAGSNTDVPGLVAVLRDGGVDSGSTAAVLGGGATARSAVRALAEVGVGPVTVHARRPDAAADLRDLAERVGLSLTVEPWEAAGRSLRCGVVVAAAPAGATDGLAGAVPPAPGLLLDVVYAPWPTPLAAAWDRAGGTVRGGLELLVRQAALQVVAMTGREVDLPVLRAAGERALATGG